MGLRSRGRMYRRLPEGAWEAGDCDGENQRHHVEAEGVPNSALALYSSLLCRWSQWRLWRGAGHGAGFAEGEIVHNILELL